MPAPERFGPIGGRCGCGGRRTGPPVRQADPQRWNGRLGPVPAAPAAGPDRYEPWLRRRLRRHRRCEWPPEPPSVEEDILQSAAVRCSAGRLPAASPWRDDGGILYHIAERRHRLRHREWAHTQADAAARRLRPRPAEEVPQAGAASMVRAGPSGRTGGFAAAARRRERGGAPCSGPWPRRPAGAAGPLAPWPAAGRRWTESER